MNKYLELIRLEEGNASIVIHPDLAEGMLLGRKKFAYLSFGNQKHFVQIKIDNQISQDRLGISVNLMEKLAIPEYPRYEIRIVKNEIILGPFIGILVSKEHKNLTRRRLETLLEYVRSYDKIQGAIVVFTLDKVDKEKGLIEGFCYHPKKQEWQQGIFPYPVAIYRRIGLSNEWKNHFLTRIGDKLFNNKYFSKWDMYQWFSADNQRNIHIPQTILYQQPQDVFQMLQEYEKIYIKPVLGLRGHGIYRLSYENLKFVFNYREKGLNMKVDFENLGEAIEFVEKRLKPGKFLIQQGIQLVKYEEGLLDFRCIVQKNQEDKWFCNAVIGRLGESGSIVSNISSGGKAYRAETILEKALPSSKEKIFALKEKISRYALDICEELDQLGIHCGTLGIDIALDVEGILWLIEINNRDPDSSIALDIRDGALYHALKIAPLLYAKSMAGFKN